MRNVVQGIIQGGGRERGLHGLSCVSALKRFTVRTEDANISLIWLGAGGHITPKESYLFKLG